MMFDSHEAFYNAACRQTLPDAPDDGILRSESLHGRGRYHAQLMVRRGANGDTPPSRLDPRPLANIVAEPVPPRIPRPRRHNLVYGQTSVVAPRLPLGAPIAPASPRPKPHVTLQPILCGWYFYMAILSLLLALSAGPRTRIGKLAGLAGLVSLAMVPALFTGIAAGFTLAAKLFVMATALVGLLLGKRSDTKLIAVLLVVAAIFPLFLHFCTVNGRGISCAFS